MTLNEIQSFILDNWKKYFQSKPEPSDFVFSIVKGRHKTIFYLFIIDSSEPRLVIKVSEGKDEDHRLIREYESLLKLKKNDNLNIIVPIPFDLVTLGSRKILIESALIGSPMVFDIYPLESRKYKSAIEQNFELALNWLINFHKKTILREPFKNNIELKNLESHWFTYIKHLCNFNYYHGVDSEEEFFEIIKHPNFTTVFSHGDFNPENILLEKGIVKVFDWEWSYHPGLPLIDLFTFCVYHHIATTIIGKARFRPMTDDDIIHVFSENTILGEIVMKYYNRYCDELKLSPEIQRIIFSLFLVRHISVKEITQILNESKLLIPKK